MAQRVTLITGGTGGLGTEVTRAFLRRGDAAVVTFVVPSEADALEKSIEGSDEAERLTLVRADVTETRGMEEAVGTALARHGRIDHLVALVGGWAGGQMVWDMEELRWQRMLELNLQSAYLAIKLAAPPMISNGYGRIVLISSRAARTLPEGQAAYAVAKAGVITLTEAAAGELRHHGVTVNCVLPSVIDTAGNRAARPHPDPSTWVKPAEIAAVITFLASEAASAVSGAAITCYGRA